jgi:hypothetical protein
MICRCDSVLKPRLGVRSFPVSHPICEHLAVARTTARAFEALVHDFLAGTLISGDYGHGRASGPRGEQSNGRVSRAAQPSQQAGGHRGSSSERHGREQGHVKTRADVGDAREPTTREGALRPGQAVGQRILNLATIGRHRVTFTLEELWCRTSSHPGVHVSDDISLAASSPAPYVDPRPRRERGLETARLRTFGAAKMLPRGGVPERRLPAGARNQIALRSTSHRHTRPSSGSTKSDTFVNPQRVRTAVDADVSASVCAITVCSRATRA